MTKDQVLKLAREAGFPSEVTTLEPHGERLQRFAQLVRNAALEESRAEVERLKAMEPVAWIYSHGNKKQVSMDYIAGVRATPLYLASGAAQKENT